MIQVGELVIDRERYLVGGNPVSLTFMEFNALGRIVSRGERVVTYEALATALRRDSVPHAAGGWP